MRILKIELLPEAKDLPLPRYQTEGSAGVDLHAAIDDPLVIDPGARALIPTGIKLAIPTGHEGQVRPRSGLAHKQGITVLNSPGTIDSDYRGQVQVILVNHGQEAFTVERGMRIAQLVIAPISRLMIRQVAKVPDTARGEGGFGHTGTGAES